MTITIGGVINPGAALTTSPFIGTIATDSSSSSTAAQVTLTPGILTSLTITFLGKYVNQTSDMSITFVPAHFIPQSGGVKIQFPPSLAWTRDISTSHTIPLGGVLTCYGLSSNVVNASISCNGVLATQTVTVTSIFSQNITAGSSVSFAIKGLFAPPTTEPVDQLTVTTLDGSSYSIDQSVGSISGLLPLLLTSYSMQTSLSGVMAVNSLGGLTYTFTLPDTLSSSDEFVIVFPSGTSITYLTTASTIPIQTTTYYSSNTTLVMIQKSINPTYSAGTQVTITFIRYKASPSVRPTDPISFTVYTNGYSKMQASATIAAVYKNYTLDVSATSAIVNSYTSYAFTFSMADPLSPSGYIEVILDPQLCSTTTQSASVQANLTVTLSGSSIKSTPSTSVVPTTLNGSLTYLLRISNLNTSTSSIPAQTVTISVSNLLNCPSVCTLTQFSASTYYTSSSIDLVAVANYSSTITLQPGSITLQSATSTATTTYSFGTLSLTLTPQNPIPANGFLKVTLPSDLQLLTVCVGSLKVGGSPLAVTAINNISDNSVSLQLGTGTVAGATLTFQLSNLLTQNTTQPTATFTARSYDATSGAIDVSSNSVTLSVVQGNSFNLLSLSRSGSTNSQAVNYTLTFEQVQNSSNVSAITITLSSLLTATSLSTVKQQFSNGSTAALVFSRSGSTIQTTLSSSSSTYTLFLSTIGNPPSTQPLTSPLLLTSYTANRLYIYSQMYAQDIVNTAPSTTLVSAFSFSSLVEEAPTALTLNLTQPSNFSTLVHKVVLDIPALFGTGSQTCSGFSGILCVLTASTLTITASNGSSLPSPIILTVSNLMSPPIGSTPQYFTVSTFDSLDYLAQWDNSSVVFENNCTFPCRTCSTASSCLSCYNASQSNLTLLFLNFCYELCPSGSFQANNSACASCDAACESCSVVATNCSSCNVSSALPYLYTNISGASPEGVCLNVCPSSSYLNASECLDCNVTCLTCNASTCLSCTAFFYLFEGACFGACPASTLQDEVNMTCLPCDANCLTCANLSTLCLSCHPFTFLANTTCLSACPDAQMFVDANQTCQPCSTSCNTCSMEAANCTSCPSSSNASLLFNGSCLSVCPQFHYPNSTAHLC
jgi:hypothetical protein